MTSLIKFNGNEKRLGFPLFPSLFDDFLTIKFFTDQERNFIDETLPLENIRETKSTYEFEISAPGMNKSDFKIEFDNNFLVVSTEHKTSTEETKPDDRYYKKEINYRAFKRVFQLPEKRVNEEEIKASYLDGILYISVPKKEMAESKLLKEIPIE